MVCAPKPESTARRYFRCRRCKRKRLHDVRFYEWYSPSARCRKCGRVINLVLPGEE